MKRMLILAVLAVMSFSVVPQTVSAHTLESDGTIGGVLHIQPDDNPLAGKQNDMNIAIKDSAGKFNAQNCDCTYEFKLNEQVVGSKAANGTATAYTFAQAGAYTIALSGKPKQGADFQPFSLNFVVRVGQADSSSASGSSQSVVRLLIFAALAIGIIGGLLLLSTKKKVTVKDK